MGKGKENWVKRCWWWSLRMEGCYGIIWPCNISMIEDRDFH